MIVDRVWAVRNIGFDPTILMPPLSAAVHSSTANSDDPEDLAREVIDFDSEAPHGQAFLSFTKATASTSSSVSVR